MIHVVLEPDSALDEVPRQARNEKDDHNLMDLDEEGITMLAERDYEL